LARDQKSISCQPDNISIVIWMSVIKLTLLRATLDDITNHRITAWIFV